MNKKVNTLIFVLGATLFNILIAIISFMVYTILYIRFLMLQLPETTRSWAFTALFLLSIGTSFLVYRAVIKHFINKIEIEKYFDPIFVRKHRKPKQED
ncbi:leader peptide processing enzyme [Treponema sp. R6D11]